MNAEEVSQRVQEILPAKEELREWLEEEFGPYIDTVGLADDLWSWLFNIAAKRMV
jgi:hypothetical protein